MEISNKFKKYVDLYYVSIKGTIHMVSALESRIYNGGSVFIDGSSVDILSIEKSDLQLIPDTETLRKYPWSDNQLYMFSYLGYSGKPFWGDTRVLTDKVNEYIKSIGYVETVGAEVEFFIHKAKVSLSPRQMKVTIYSNDIHPRGYIPEKSGYDAIGPSDSVWEIRKQIIDYLAEIDINVPSHHHEVASYGQVEINTPSGSAKKVSDFIVNIKLVSKYVTSRHGLLANFMPKPIFSDNGSGMHIHISLWSDGSNAFYDPSSKYRISQTGRYFIGGLIEHGRSLSAIASPSTNSYKRLIPGYEAPTLLVWGMANRSAAIRVPLFTDPKNCRIEYRPPDPLANPYLAITAIIMAGIDGIKKKIDPGDPINTNVYQLGDWKIKELGIKSLPASLDEALSELETDMEYLKPVIPRELIDTYIEIKRREIMEINRYPTPAEFIKYLNY